MSVTADQIQPVWQSYLDVQNDVKPWLQIDATDTSNDTKLRFVAEMGCQWVQNYLGRPVAPTEFFRRFSGSTGWNGSYVCLPYYPVLSIVSIVEFWGLSGGHTLVYQTPEAQGGAGEQMYQMDWVRGIVTRTYQGLIQRPFFPGSSNLEVTWTAGFNPLPADLKVATLELVAYWWRNTQESPRWFAAGAQYDGDQRGNPLWPAVPNRITMLLEPYTQVGIG